VKGPCLSGLLILLAAPVWAQAVAPAPGSTRPRDEAFRMVDAYIMSNLQESLGLTDEQFVKVLPLVKRLQRDRREFTQRRFQALQALRREFRAGAATEARVAELLRELKGIELEEGPTIRRDMEAIDGVLGAVQQAKYRLLEVEVERKIRELVNQMRAQHRQNRMRRPGADSQEPPPQ